MGRREKSSGTCHSSMAGRRRDRDGGAGNGRPARWQRPPRPEDAWPLPAAVRRARSRSRGPMEAVERRAPCRRRGWRAAAVPGGGSSQASVRWACVCPDLLVRPSSPRPSPGPEGCSRRAASSGAVRGDPCDGRREPVQASPAALCPTRPGPQPCGPAGPEQAVCAGSRDDRHRMLRGVPPNALPCAVCRQP